MRRAVFLLALLAGCGGAESVTTTVAPTQATTTQSTTTQAATTTTSATTTSMPPATTATSTTTLAPRIVVDEPGTFDGAEFEVRISFESQIEGVSSADFAEQSITILSAAEGWGRAGFSFESDPGSQLRVVLAEGPEVDALCLPLETYGKVSCQNGPVVALNADRWRIGGDDWDSTIEAYRTYLINHEVGHLIGLRHPVERCPTDSKISALMEPQTNNLQDCVGNGIPLDWEIDWARNRPIVAGPYPDWDGPRPNWPSE